jgi:hypothetical protein
MLDILRIEIRREISLGGEYRAYEKRYLPSTRLRCVSPLQSYFARIIFVIDLAYWTGQNSPPWPKSTSRVFAAPGTIGQDVPPPDTKSQPGPEAHASLTLRATARMPGRSPDLPRRSGCHPFRISLTSRVNRGSLVSTRGDHVGARTSLSSLLNLPIQPGNEYRK